MRPVGQGGQRRARPGGMLEGRPVRALQRPVPRHQRQRRLQIARPLLAPADHPRPERPLVRVGRLHRPDHRQRHLALAEVVADVLAECGAQTAIVEQVVDDLEAHPQRVAIGRERAHLRLRARRRSPRRPPPPPRRAPRSCRAPPAGRSPRRSRGSTPRSAAAPRPRRSPPRRWPGCRAPAARRSPPSAGTPARRDSRRPARSTCCPRAGSPSAARAAAGSRRRRRRAAASRCG